MLRSVAVMLAAPLVALPAGGAEDDAQPIPAATQRAERVVPVTAEPAQPAATELVSAARRPSPGESSRPSSSGSGRPPATTTPDVPVSVSVDCANDGCVVQDGLDVRVVVP
ncbi:MAG: hypothetical protein JNL21_36685 [Myxococcales bacterium]|nr:hypothetical protein [Myxococcales bacterium]